MLDWLLSSIDPSRAHAVGFAVSWHGRTMVLGWAILAPLAVLAARFLKVLPWQNWPHELDNKLWWRAHWIGQVVVVALTLVGIGLIFNNSDGINLHGRLGYAVLLLAFAQVALGIFRGTKGGPTAPAKDGSLHGDHYDMTTWRVTFEWIHKSLGYVLICTAAATVVLGLWHANAPRWMWLIIAGWWAGLIALALILQRRGWAVDTYQAIWGPGPEHPGNRRKPMGWGMRRRELEHDHVRSD
ncbi:MAG: cytochrome b561 domain-containing protein [Pseudomonadota bacterium]